MMAQAAQVATQLDSAIGKLELVDDGVLYSGHGRGFSVIGSLRGNPEQFVGLKYRYPGYISTSSDRGKAENFLRTRAGGGGTPVLLELRLIRGQHMLPMDVGTGQVGEAEYLLPKNLEFDIVDARWTRIDGVENNALHLVLQRTGQRVPAPDQSRASS